jgi:hypothetical protein
LSKANDKPHNDEDLVVANSTKNVNLILDLSSGNHVEDVQQDEGVEDDCEMSRWTVLINQGTVEFCLSLVKSSVDNSSFRSYECWVLSLLWDPQVTSKGNDENNNGLVESHPQDVL